jgi:hypothetical protein
MGVQDMFLLDGQNSKRLGYSVVGDVYIDNEISIT